MKAERLARLAGILRKEITTSEIGGQLRQLTNTLANLVPSQDPTAVQAF